MAVALNNSGKVLGTSLGLFFLSLFLTAYSARNPEIGRLGFAAVGELERPFQLVNHAAQSGVIGAWDHYVALLNVREENDRLVERVNSLEARNSRLLEFESENKRLQQLLKVTEEHKLEGVVASVIGYDPSSWLQAVVLNRGSRHGVEPGMAVLEGDGLVGQVTSVSYNSSRVLLITDPLSGVDAIVQGSRARGVVEGNGGKTSSWRFVLKEEEVHIGDRVISSGFDGVYPKGLLIGVIVDINSKNERMFRSISIKPAVDFAKLETVLIVKHREQ